VSAALSVLLLLLSDDIPVTGNRRLPSEVAGTWDVVRVAVDNQDASHWGFRPNDPRLLGRTLTVDSVHVRFEDGKELGCKQSTWPARQSTWGYLFSKGFPRPPDGGRSPTPSPEDFEVKVAKNQRAIAYSLCPSPGRGTNRFPADFWVAPLGSEQLALHYDNQVLLLFQRRPPGAKPTASFDCAKAASPTEKTICASFDLASWDRSVSQAWRTALDRRPQKQAHLRKTQKEWLHTRDACGNKAECIDDLQWRRVDELTQE
jgi:uncharacterized protein YecT (DUF1311 family)